MTLSKNVIIFSGPGPGTLCPACSRCLPAPTHLFLSAEDGPEVKDADWGHESVGSNPGSRYITQVCLCYCVCVWSKQSNFKQKTSNKKPQNFKQKLKMVTKTSLVASVRGICVFTRFQHSGSGRKQ